MLNKVKCNISQAVARLGGIHCDEKQVLGYILIDRMVRIDPETFDKAALDLLIAQDKVIGTIKDWSAEDANVDGTFTDLPNGDRIQNTIGAKRWNITHYEGNCFQNELNKLNTSNRYGLLLVFDNGTFLGQETKEGLVKGFDVRLFTGVKNVKTGADGGGSMLMIDIVRSSMSAWQGSSGVYESTEIDFLDIEPIAGLDIQVPALVAAATTTVVSISNLCSDSPVTGLLAADLRMVRNGVAEAITSLTEVNGVYTLTHAALVADDEISFKTFSAGYNVVDVDTNYYAGESLTKTVA